MKAVVIGAGFGGLASALRLRALGCEVDVLERCPDPGGRARNLVFHDTGFDAGPTVITAPWLFDELFSLFGETRSDAIEFLPCDPWYRLLFADGSEMDLVSSIEEQERQIARISPEDMRHYQRFLAHSQQLYKVGYEELGAVDFSSFRRMLQTLPALLSLGGFSTLWKNTGRFFKDRRIRQAFSLPSLLVGGNPITTTAIYGLIHAMERRGGIWFARGGTTKLVEALVELGKRHGIRFHYNQTVTGFHTSDKQCISHVEVSQADKITKHACDAVVWGGDPQALYKILGHKKLSLSERLRQKTVQSSMGLYVLYFKTSREYSDVAHHSIVLSARWEELLKDIFTGHNLPSDPSLYLHRPAATDSSMRREGEDLFYVLAPVPHLGNFDRWQSEENRFKQTVLSILEQRVLPNLSSELIFAESVDTRYFRDTLLSPLGAGFSIAPLLSQSAWFRFHNSMDKIPNMYLCGAGVHPGGGLPGVVTSAKVVESLIRRTYTSPTKHTSTHELQDKRRVA